MSGAYLKAERLQYVFVGMLGSSLISMRAAIHLLQKEDQGKIILGRLFERPPRVYKTPLAFVNAVKLWWDENTWVS